MVTDREMETASHPDFAPTIWADDTNDALEYEMVLPTLVNTSYESQMTLGRILRIPIRGNLDTQTKTEGVSNLITFQAPVGTSTEYGVGTSPATHQDVTVSTYEYAAQLLNSVLAVQSNYDERTRTAHALGYALARGVEVTIAALFGSFSQIVGTLGADPDDAILRRAWQYLADVGVQDNATFVLNPSAIAALFGSDKFTSGDFVGKKVIESATLPMIYGYGVVRSNLLATSCTGVNCALLHKNSIILIRQIQPTVREQFLIRNIADGIVAYNLYAAEAAAWSAEAPTDDADPTVGDFGAVLIRTN